MFENKITYLIHKLKLFVLTMNKSRSYEAFTLVEMLIVMGIIIVLMGVGITAGRFAINRANDVAHQNAADQIYQALQAYYTDEREFPAATTPMALLAEDGDLAKYLDSGAFDGSTDASFAYWVQPAADGQQETMICVTLGGIGDSKSRGVYCNGNSFGGDFVGGAVTEKTIDPLDSEGGANAAYTAIAGATDLSVSDWSTDTGWGASTAFIAD